MSRELGRVALPNGGELTVTAYAGPGKGRRLQLTLEQGEGGIVAHGNTDADGVAELVGMLETWLLEQGRHVSGEPLGPWSRVAARQNVERALELVHHLEDEDDAGPVRRGGLVEELEKRLREALKVLPPQVAQPGAAIDGPSPALVRDRAPGSLAEHAARRETPASDRLETNDVSTSLEDFGKVGEERDLTVSDVANAVGRVRGSAEELAAYGAHNLAAVKRSTVLELEELTQTAGRYLLAVRELEDMLRLAESQG